MTARKDGCTQLLSAAKAGMSERSVQRNIQKLQQDGFLRRVGGRKEGHREVTVECNLPKKN